jgi:hypothetical protein
MMMMMMKKKRRKMCECEKGCDMNGEAGKLGKEALGGVFQQSIPALTQDIRFYIKTENGYKSHMFPLI